MTRTTQSRAGIDVESGRAEIAATASADVAHDRLQVLVIEDSRIQAAKVRFILQSEGMEATLAETFEQTLALLRSRRFDLLLLDIYLPDAVAVERLAEMQALAPNSAIILLTAADDEMLAKESLALGAQDYLVKTDLDPRDLLRAIRYGIERHRVLERLDSATRMLREKNEALERLSAQKDQIVGMAAHDLRGPIGSIFGYASLLAEEEDLPEKHLQLVTHIRESSEFLLDLIDELLDLSAIESGRLTLNLAETDAVDLVQRTVEVNRLFAGARGITLDLATGPVPQRLRIDAMKIAQVLNSLISNALKFSPRRTTVIVSMTASEEGVTVAVRDSGPGVPADAMARLFMPFQRTSAVANGGERCAGLGLAIAKRIVEGHGGRIWVENNVDCGATFAFFLPRASH
ncbi:MAG TPA: hybrid sensor histidine kinase/response regulator [Thermoanaerobaculia bacterium]|nr:hybrid sensor histidine kinase/response regulator [Thermoanaerobaculia bacterium]